MKRLNWLAGLRTTLSLAPVRTIKVHRCRPRETRLLAFEPLEDRRVLAVDFGDAPDTAFGTGVGNYNTLATDNGAQHTIIGGIRMGANVDGDGGTLQNAAANADDIDGTFPGDEDSLVNPAADLVLTVGAQPTVSLRVTNTTGSTATLYGWIDYNGNGAFANASERAAINIPSGFSNAVVTLTFPAVPVGAASATYARFRLSTDSAAANATGAAANGEVEDYRVTIVSPSASSVVSSKTQKIAHELNGGPDLAEGDSFGSAVASLGDLDGDGVTDLAVGAQSRDAAGGNGGAVHILFMNANGTVKNRQTIASGMGGGPILTLGDYFGRSLANLGDVDGDGVVDLAVGADRDDTGGSLRGAVYVLFLNSNGTVKSSLKIAHNTSGGPALSNVDRFGSAVANLGDLDGDGIVDIAVGANADNIGGLLRGAVHVLFLNSNGTVKAAQKIASGVGGAPAIANDSFFGSSLAGLGDLDGDGITELAVGVPGDATGGYGRGAVQVLMLNANGTVKASQKIASGVGGGPVVADADFFGTSVARAGDLDGDGVTDMVVGARYDDGGGNNRGAIYMLLLNSNGTAKNVQKIGHNTGGGPSLADADLFGRSATSLGDLDGDGRTDFAVGAERDDTGGPVGSNRGAVYVLYTGVVNTNPVFTSASTANVAENNTAVMTVTAADAEAPPQAITFSIVGGVDQARFSITAGGALSFISAPDFEAPGDANGDNIYVVTVQASDGQGGTALQTITVGVTAVNESNPVFTSTATANVAENTTAVKTVTATDSDLPAQAVTFSIVGGVDQARFSITSGGALSFTAAPNFEAPIDANGDNVYVVTVQASDGQGGTTTQAISVTVTPVNESSPAFSTPNTASVLENTTSVMTVTATDADLPSQSITFSIAPSGPFTSSQTNNNDVFSPNVLSYSFSAAPPPVGNATLTLTAIADLDASTEFLALNAEGLFSQNFFVTGGLQQQLVSTTAIIPQAVLQQLTADGVISITVTPSTSVNNLGTNFLTLDLSYPIGFDNSKFSITPGGALSFVTPPNFEAPTDANGDNIYVVAVQASDGQGGTTTQTINVTVTPANDNNPVFTSTNTANVAENITFVKNVTATDADLPAQFLAFSIVGGVDQARFGITPGGALSFVTPPNFEAPTDANGDNIYVVAVQASDGQGGTTTQTINVTVTPANDNNPVFTSTNTANVAENITFVKNVTATDADLPAQFLAFSIVGGVDQARFSITSGGALSFLAAPNFEAPTDANGDNIYLVNVQASDGQGGTAVQTVVVSVTPVNDNNPVFTSTNTANVAENSVFVKTVTATDADTPAQTVTFSIVGGVDQARFSITTGGALTFNSVPNFEAPSDANGDNVYVVTVQASDGAGGTSTQTISVTVTPVNDNSPVFTSTNAASVPENTTAVKTVTASDGDLPTQIVTFSIVGGVDQARFSITIGGVLSFVAAPNFEAPTDANGDNVYVVTVQASDGLGGTATQTISVTVTPVNDNNPVFTSTNTANVAENTTSVKTVTATDADLPAQAVTFSIVGGVDLARFSITPGGALSFLAAPNFEAPSDANGDNIYLVNVQASDGQGGTAVQTVVVSVTPVNDNNPVFTSSATANIVENTTFVTNVTATDADLPAQSITFSIVGGVDQGRFTMTPGGALSFAAPPSFEFPTDANGDNVYVVSVQASDGAGGTSLVTINVTVSPGPTDFGDAPDNAPGTGPGNYQTLRTDNGPWHSIVAGLQMGAHVDGVDGGVLQNAAANADDVNAALPDDEDGVVQPAVDLAMTVGSQPTVAVRVTNTTGATATLYGWIDYNADGVFDNATERAEVSVPGGTSNGVVTLAFTTVPVGATGTTYARLRLSTDAAAANPTGPAVGGEVEDYQVTITSPSASTAVSSRMQKIAHLTGGGPELADLDLFGGSVVALGDLDGDGVTDLAVGAHSQDPLVVNAGAVHILFMNSDGTAKSVQKIASGIGGGPVLADGDYFGRSIANLGDLDGDGVTDIAVGADRDDTGGNIRGAFYVLFLNSNGTVKNSQKVAQGVGGGPALADVDRFGVSVANLGDIDGDGVIDLAVGANADDTGGTDRGAIYVFLMNSTGSVKATQKLASGVAGVPSLTNGALFGTALSAVGDLDGDGISELAVGTPGDATGGYGRGAVHVLFLNASGTVKHSSKIANSLGGGPLLNDLDFFGTSTSSGGDLDGDGVNDLLVTARYDDTGGNNRGAVYVLLLNADGTTRNVQKIADGTGGGPSLADADLFGRSVAAIGDLNGDGRIDLAVGAERDDTGGAVGSNRGAIYVLFLTPNGDYDRNGDVDGNDFLTWQRGIGSPVTPADSATDGDRDGVVGGGDLAVWRTNYGTASAAVVAAAMEEVVAAVIAPASEVVAAIEASVYSAIGGVATRAPESLITTPSKTAAVLRQARIATRLSKEAPHSVPASDRDTALLAWLSRSTRDDLPLEPAVSRQGAASAHDAAIGELIDRLPTLRRGRKL